MADADIFELEIKRFIEEIPNLNRQDRFNHLMAIFKKHFEIDKTAHVLTITDFHSIVNYAKSQYVNTVLPMTISKKEVYPTEVGNYLIMEAVIAHLNHAGALKKMVNFDITTKTNK